MKRTILAAGALIAAPLLLTACGNATAGDQVPSDKIPAPAPKAFGSLDLMGEKLQCSTGAIAHGVAEVIPESVGFTDPLDAANALIETSLEEQADTFKATTELTVAAAGSTGEQAEKDGVVNTIEIDATNRDGHVVGVILVNPAGKGGAWIAGGMTVCDGGSTE